MTTRLYTNTRNEVEAYLGEFADEYDVDTIVGELDGMGVESIDDMDQDDFVDVIKRHYVGGDPIGPCDWVVSWTSDDEGGCRSRGFDSFYGARAFADRAQEVHGEEPGFMVIASRLMDVNLESFLNANSGGAVELAPHLLATAE